MDQPALLCKVLLEFRKTRTHAPPSLTRHPGLRPNNDHRHARVHTRQLHLQALAKNKGKRVRELPPPGSAEPVLNGLPVGVPVGHGEFRP